MYHFGPKSWVWIWVVGMGWGWSCCQIVGESVGVCILSHVTAKKKVKMIYSATGGGRSRIQRQDASRLIK